MLFLAINMIAQNMSEEDLISYESVTSDSTSIIKEDIHILTKSDGKGTHIRWAPTTPLIWQLGKDLGYQLEKRNGSTGNFESITGGPIVPWPEAKWEQNMAAGTDYFKIAAMSMYGKSEVVGFVNEANDVANRHGFSLLAADIDRKAAEAQGLYYYLPHAANDYYEEYRIYVVDEDNKVYSDTASVLIAPLSKEIFSAPTLEATGKESAVELRWSGGGRTRQNDRFTAYYIERSADNVTYERVLEEPFMNTTSSLRPTINQSVYIDSIQNGIEYHYRVIGIDAFGDLSSPSNTVNASARDLTPPAMPSRFKVAELQKGSLTLTWEWAAYDAGDQDLAGFNIYKSNQEKGIYTKLNTKTLAIDTRAYTDNGPDLLKLNFYYVEAIDVNGNTIKSLIDYNQIVDSTPPDAPTAISAVIDSSGIVLLEWKAPLAQDITGYELFFSNEKEASFIKFNTPIIKNEFFIDSITLKTLSEVKYYKVVAVDYNYNRSEASEIVTLQRPDIIPPAPSVFTNYQVLDEGIELHYAISKSNDVKAIELYRKTDQSDWETVEAFDPSLSKYLDGSVMEGVFYEYNLITIDDASNTSSPVKTVRLEAKKSFYLKDIPVLTLSNKDDNVIIEWTTESSDNYQYVIYKKVNKGQPFTLVRTGEKAKYIDKKVSTKNNYEYSIMAVAKDGRTTKLSPYQSISM